MPGDLHGRRALPADQKAWSGHGHQLSGRRESLSRRVSPDGAASVQLIADPRQTMLARRLIDLGYSAVKVLAELRASDPFIERRQIGVVDSFRHTAAFSGPDDTWYSGHVEGDNFVAMGNAIVSKAVVTAMAESMADSAGTDWPTG